MPTLDWIGKRAVLNHHREIPFHLLRSNPEMSVGMEPTGNLLVQGDNLLALKALQPFYARQVKCIYIDPPYNTGNEKWIYNDAVNSPEIREWLGQLVKGEVEDLTRHDKWLCMMYPRLQLLRTFLRDDGVIFVSIDDNELGHLLPLMDEVFGRQNFIATLVWEKGKKGDAKFFSVTHEYIVVFARNKAALTRAGVRWRRRKPGVDEVLTQYAGLRETLGSNHAAIRAEMMAWYKSLPAKHPAKAHKHYNWSDDRGLYFPDNFHGPDDGRESRPRYDILHPTTGLPCKKPSTGWRWEESRTLAALAEDPPRVHFGPDHTTIPNRKSYLFEVNTEPFSSVFYKDGRAATLQVEALLGKGAFEFPKDADVLADLIGLVTGKGDIILDSFAGSGTTAHAVMLLNERDGGHRRYVLVELDEDIARSKTIRSIDGAARFIESQRPPGNDTHHPALGCSYVELGETLLDESYAIRSSVTYDQLGHFVYFSETGLPLPPRTPGRAPLLGVHEGEAIYLLYNGVLGDRRPDGGNVLTTAILDMLPAHDGPKIVYGEGCRLGAARLDREQIVFKQTPYDVRVG